MMRLSFIVVTMVLFAGQCLAWEGPPVNAPELPDDFGGTAPKGAVVLFDGTDLSKWRSARTGEDAPWRLHDDESLEVVPGTGDLWSRDSFRDVRLHLEWWSPPGGVGQGGGNSGIKLQKRYEVQILNTPAEKDGLTDNEAGAIYGFFSPQHNASRGPGAWQSYDIWFRAPRFDGDTKTEDARITVYWNGTLVHDDVALPGVTGANRLKETTEPEAILLQDHGAPVRFRNIWLIKPPSIDIPAGPVPTFTFRVGERVSISPPPIKGVVDRFEISPAPPAGMSFDPTSGSLEGAPTEATDVRAYVVRAVNEAGAAELRVRIGVNP